MTRQHLRLCCQPRRQNKMLAINVSANHGYHTYVSQAVYHVDICTIQYNTLTLHVSKLTFISAGGGDGGGVTNDKDANQRPQSPIGSLHFSICKCETPRF